MHAAWADDPVAFAEAHFTALSAAHGQVAERAARTVALAGAEHALAGQVAAAGEGSLHRLGGARWRALAAAARGARTRPINALAVLGMLTRKLGEARSEIARLSQAGPIGKAVAGAVAADVTDWGEWTEVEADLAE